MTYSGLLCDELLTIKSNKLYSVMKNCTKQLKALLVFLRKYLERQESETELNWTSLRTLRNFKRPVLKQPLRSSKISVVILWGPFVGLNLNHRLFRLWQYSCHCILPQLQYIISTERNESVYAWATLGIIWTTRNCTMMSMLQKRKTSFPMKLISIMVGTLISEISVFDA